MQAPGFRAAPVAEGGELFPRAFKEGAHAVHIAVALLLSDGARRVDELVAVAEELVGAVEPLHKVFGRALVRGGKGGGEGGDLFLDFRMGGKACCPSQEQQDEDADDDDDGVDEIVEEQLAGGPGGFGGRFGSIGQQQKDVHFSSPP